jgi:hypothetical protein
LTINGSLGHTPRRSPNAAVLSVSAWFVGMLERRDTSPLSATSAISQNIQKPRKLLPGLACCVHKRMAHVGHRNGFHSFPTGDTPMATATQTRPSTADVLYAQTSALFLIEQLRDAVANMPLPDAVSRRGLAETFGELDDLHDEVDGLLANFQKNFKD